MVDGIPARLLRALFFSDLPGHTRHTWLFITPACEFFPHSFVCGLGNSSCYRITERQRGLLSTGSIPSQLQWPELAGMIGLRWACGSTDGLYLAIAGGFPVNQRVWFFQFRRSVVENGW